MREVRAERRIWMGLLLLMAGLGGFVWMIPH